MERQAREGGKQTRRRRLRGAIFAVICALVLGAAAYLLFSAFWSAHVLATSETT